jgi:ligand-binding sensor domain-containing protein/signal transduction histidine kinase
MNRRTLQSAGLWLCIFSFALPAFLRAAEQPDSSFVVDSWGNEEGLPQSSVISVVQTKDGYLWLGTLDGLVRFDGIHFTVFNENNTPGLDSDRIVFLFEDSRTNLWIGTEPHGLAAMKNGVIKNFGTENAAGGKVIDAYEDAAANVLFSTEGGLLLYHDGKMDFYPGAASPLFSHPPERIVVPSKSGGFWQIINGTAQKLERNGVGKDFGAGPWNGTPVTSACEDSRGNLIVGTHGDGIFWSDADGKWQNISTNQGLSSVYVLSLCMDRAGNLWAGTDGGGLDRIKRKIFNAPPELHPYTAQSISEDERGGLWAAFNAHGISRWATNSTLDFGVGQYSDAWTIFAGRQQVWAGTRDEGLFQFQTNHFIPAPGAEILGPQIFALFEDRAGQLWAGTQNGLGNFDGQKWKLFTTRDGLSENTVRAIAQDAAGNFWIGTENSGLDYFASGKFSAVLRSEGGLPGNDISCLYTGNDGALWVGTSGHGLARLQDGKWTRYSTANGLASDSISYVIEDGAGDLWVGSNMGLMRIQKKALDDFADGKTNSISCRTYGKTDGLPTRECSSGSQPAAIRATDGKLFFPTTKGVVSVNPAELKPNSQPPAVLIESVKVDGREQKTNALSSAWPQSVVIPPGYEQLEIDYTALDFSAPELVRFKCWLEGHETAPADVGGERVARYPKLPPGNYHFHVMAANEDGVWNETGAVLEITVQPWFWQTDWFRVAAIIFLLGIVAAIVRYISTQKLQRELQLLKQQETLERERSRIARDLHDQLGANLTQVTLLGEMAEADKDSPAEIEAHARQISQTARETTRSLDEIVWAINPSNDTLEGLVNYACKYAQEYLALAGVRYRAEVPGDLPALQIPPPVRHNVFLAFKEAVHNVVKHAQASEAWIWLRLSPENFILEIEDNGRGIGNAAAPQNRNGLRNMKKRMEDIGGNFEIHAANEKGTVVKLTAPVIFNHG